jgi:hypothetical protein
MADSQRGGGFAYGGQDIPEAERELLEAARAGRLAEYLRAQPGRGYATLYIIVSEVVYQRFTRPFELDRAHYRCADGPDRMDQDCHDRYQDDVEAAHAYVLDHADEHFENLRGWLASRLTYITVDANRRRRSQREALQRPRLPSWLAEKIGEDGWLRKLSINILDWAGVPTTAGHQLWPLRAWVEQRALSVAEPEISEAEMQAEVDRVLAAMRTRPKWYERYVERPLGHKQPPLAPAQRGGENGSADGFREPDYVRYLEPDEADEALLAELASAAIEEIAERTAEGAPVRETVAEVLAVVFGADTGADEMDRPPAGGRAQSPRERAAQLILDDDVLDRVVAAVQRIRRQNPPQ